MSHFFKKLTLFEWLLLVLASLQLIHFAILSSNQNFPIPLLCGPIFWVMGASLAKKSNSYIAQNLIITLIPYFLFSTWRLLVDEAAMWSYLCWYIPIMLSLQTLYPIVVMMNLKRWRIKGEEAELLKQLMVFSLGISFFVCILFLKNYAKIDFTLDINPIHTIALATVFSAFVMMSYMRNFQHQVFSNSLVKKVDKNEDREPTVSLGSKLSKLLLMMEQEKLYLDPKLTLEKIASRSSYSKAEIANLLSDQLGYSYYEWLATYRIKHAINMLEVHGDEYKLEAVAHASGFLSKTTFNRYFKDIVGVPPSSYREQIYKKQVVV